MEKLRGKKAVIFDLDGVLIDSETIHQRRNEQMFADYGWEVEPKVLEMMIGSSPSMNPWKMIYDQTNLSIDYATYHKMIDDYRTTHPIDETMYMKAGYPDVLETVSKLYDAGYKLAVASSSAMDYIRNNIHYCHIDSMISVVRTGRDLPKSKPDPLIYTLTIKDLMVKPEQTVIIEDSSYGIQAGKAAGGLIMAVHGYQFGLDQHLADIKVNELHEILEYLI